jgi:hypothetical protein
MTSEMKADAGVEIPLSANQRSVCLSLGRIAVRDIPPPSVKDVTPIWRMMRFVVVQAVPISLPNVSPDSPSLSSPTLAPHSSKDSYLPSVSLQRFSPPQHPCIPPTTSVRIPCFPQDRITMHVMGIRVWIAAEEWTPCLVLCSKRIPGWSPSHCLALALGR